MTYNGKVITILTGFLAIVLFVVGIILQTQTTQDSTSSPFIWGGVLISTGIALIIPVITLFLFKHIGKNTDRDKDRHIFGKVSTNGKMGEQYWVKLIDQLSATNDDVYFYGHGLRLWRTEKRYINALHKQLNKRQRRDDIRNTIYFILHDAKAYEAWKSILEEKQYTNIQILLLEEKNSYSIVCCGNKISVTMRLHEGRTGDCPTLDIKRESAPGQMFLEFLEGIKKARQDKATTKPNNKTKQRKAEQNAS